ncbi:M20/M25/M40 family metallo-hydrolase [Streptomyces sp. ST2-7A]|uniref:M20/M25/M40 family metallo-hydrolase n=1 Tax=Streptomyces sp. ST2-7A TaxID=2907214 RepID=UPI001F270B77|nr:M20/M25/M40 family metallo-hydrolase [Streptomyces sp. ST2-7A]MCE7081637.1 M20/M25/M40 family metallo-hydrolase [Streptomyces sp. ST2-7A]
MAEHASPRTPVTAPDRSRRPDRGGSEAGPPDPVDRRALDEAVDGTAELIRVDTVNRGGGDGREREAAEWVAERLAGAGLEPRLLEKAPGRTNVVARLPGTEPGADALLVHGHLDVVPADAADWTVPPFAGEIRDGVVWGRGAVDMKNAVAMTVALVRAWSRAGVRPRRDIVLAFTADEEDTAEYGAGHLVREHADLFDGCTEAIGESGAFTCHTADGRRLYPVAAGERGTSWVRLTARGRAGHGSKVNRENAVGRLAAAVNRIAEHHWPLRLAPAVRAALIELAVLHGVRPSGGTPSGVSANGSAGTGSEDDRAGTCRRAWEAVLADTPGDPAHIATRERAVTELLEAIGPAATLVASTVRNSANPTVLNAGGKINVIPGRAEGAVDGRVVPGGEEEFTETMDRLTGPSVDWEYHHHMGPLEAPLDSRTYAVLRGALSYFDPGAHVVPYFMSGGTDAKQFARLGIVGYGFTPLRLPPGFDYQAMFHGVDERVPAEALHFGVRALDRALRTL